MSRRALLAWRKSRRSLFAMLLLAAIVAYGIELYTASRIGRALRPRSNVVRIFGVDAQAFAGGTREAGRRAILLKPKQKGRPAFATWVFSEYATRALRAQLGTASPVLVIRAARI